MARIIRVSDIVGAARDFASSLRGPVENWDGMTDADIEARINNIVAHGKNKLHEKELKLTGKTITLPTTRAVLSGGNRAS